MKYSTRPNYENASMSGVLTLRRATLGIMQTNARFRRLFRPSIAAVKWILPINRENRRETPVQAPWTGSGNLCILLGLGLGKPGCQCSPDDRENWVCNFALNGYVLAVNEYVAVAVNEYVLGRFNLEGRNGGLDFRTRD